MNETKNYGLEDLLAHNRDILTRIEKQLQPKFSVSKNKKNIGAFFHNTRRLVMKIEKTLPADATLSPGYSRRDDDNLANQFQHNIQVMLELIPDEKKTTAMAQLSESFMQVIKKITTHLKGDDNWLKASPQPSPSTKPKPDSPVDGSFKLTMEDSEPTTIAEPVMEPKGNLNKLQNVAPVSPVTEMKKKSGKLAPYPPEYNNLSDKKKLGYILDPLFDLLFPKYTLILAMKHCKKRTGKSLSAASEERLGKNEKGNTTLYRILSDEIMAKMFNDDRIISALGQTLNIPLLKMVIATALHRLKKNPGKFPILGGVSFFMDLEVDILGSSNIKETLLLLITTRLGAKGIFQPASKKERRGLEVLFENEPNLYTTVLDALPRNQVRAKRITEYWNPKFAGFSISHSNLTPTEISEFFSPEKAAAAKQVLLSQHR